MKEKKVRITVCLDPSILDYVDTLRGEAGGMSQSGAVQRIIEEHQQARVTRLSVPVTLTWEKIVTNLTGLPDGSVAVKSVEMTPDDQPMVVTVRGKFNGSTTSTERGTDSSVPDHTEG